MSFINHNGDIYSSVTTHFNEYPMYSSASNGVSGYDRISYEYIVIHHNATTDKNVAMNTWLESNGKWTSAHYEIADNEIWGCVGEQYCAFHSGDADMNRRSIGLEHVNATGSPNWTISEETYQSSAELIAELCQRHNIPCDSAHIIPHRQVSSTACPGGIDMTKLIAMANKIINNDSKDDKQNKQTEEINMFTISAQGRGIGFVQGGVFFPLLDANDPVQFWNTGVKNIQVSAKTFDAIQGKAQKSTLDDDTVNKLIKGLK
ncbi:TPA: N-acetylmuramoyl-L-alanine amidase [Streptococcus agalactiae]|nr:N-acetylmuramoyl-L-alanine amidase [Streptococcus agalactiae]